MGFLALTFLLLHKLYQQPVLAHQIMPFFLVLGLAGVPAALFFSFLALLEFQQPHFFHFQPCWSSSSPIFFIFSLAGVPAASFFSFSALLEFQQPHFFHFQPCWSSSSPIFFIFSLAGVPAAPFFSFSTLLEFQQPHPFFIRRIHWHEKGQRVPPPLSCSVERLFLGLGGQAERLLIDDERVVAGVDAEVLLNLVV